MSDLLQLAVYNPAILKDSDFLAGFVARREAAEDIVKRLHEITPRSLARHRLILGQRGMGKTSLLRRIALGIRDDEVLSKRLLPLTFREEQYNVHNLHTFWCNCLDALGDHFERREQHDRAVELDRQVAGLNRARTGPAGDDEADAALAALKQWGKREGKRILLLIDNIDLILDGLTRQHWALRRTLQEAGGIIVIGAATAYLEATADPKGAFYDFFQVTPLERLSQDELLACLRRLAAARGDSGRKVLHILDTDPGRIRTLHDLTGGNLRTLVLLYLLMERDVDDDVMRDLERLLDEVTVLYKARVEDLAPQARVVLDAAALNWNPVTAAELAGITGMETSAVSTQLDRLARNGIVEKTSVSTSARAAYQLGERFFNIWYLMRHGPRRQRTRLRWLTGFLRGFYSPQQLTAKAMSLLRRRGGGDQTLGHYCLALGDAVDDENLRNLLGQEARRGLERLAAQQGKRLEDILDPQELPTPKTAREWFGMGFSLHVDFDRYEEAEAAYRRAIELDPNYTAPWNCLGILMYYDLKRYEEAESAYRQAIQLDSKDAFPWIGLGNLLQHQLSRHDEAESAYRQSIKLDPNIAPPWYGLGNLLQQRLNRYGEAEAAYRQAIQLDPKRDYYWSKLGDLLEEHLGRTAEAIQAYRKCLELDPDDIGVVTKLAYLLLGSGSGEEAEQFFQLALSKLPSHGAATLRAYAALTRDNFGEATDALQNGLENKGQELHSSNFDGVLRVLRLAATKNYGDKLLAWLDESGLADRYWPLRVAFDAYLHGEARLGDVNPEVGNAARCIYQSLANVPSPSANLPAASPPVKTKSPPRKRKTK